MKLAELQAEQHGWITIGGEARNDVAHATHQRVSACVAAKSFTWDEVGYVSAVSMRATRGDLQVSEEQLEKIRRACQVWDVDLRMKDVTSHRRFVGPFIVAAKKVIYPVLQAFMKDFIRQQRAFNAATLALIIDLYAQRQQATGTECPDRSEIEN
jgi:hypothetical protein